MKATLYYDEFEPGELIGRALTQGEYDDLTLFDLQAAIGHSSAGLCLFDTDSDMRFTPEFYNFSIDELKEKLKEQGAIVIRSHEWEWRNEFPLFARGPRKGLPNFKKEPDVYFDRLYLVDYKEELIAVEAEIEQHDDGTFTVAEEGKTESLPSSMR
jgi:hypothetical protein